MEILSLAVTLLRPLVPSFPRENRGQSRASPPVPYGVPGTDFYSKYWHWTYILWNKLGDETAAELALL